MLFSKYFRLSDFNFLYLSLGFSAVSNSIYSFHPFLFFSLSLTFSSASFPPSLAFSSPTEIQLQSSICPSQGPSTIVPHCQQLEYNSFYICFRLTSTCTSALNSLDSATNHFLFTFPTSLQLFHPSQNSPGINGAILLFCQNLFSYLSYLNVHMYEFKETPFEIYKSQCCQLFP